MTALVDASALMPCSGSGPPPPATRRRRSVSAMVDGLRISTSTRSPGSRYGTNCSRVSLEIWLTSIWYAASFASFALLYNSVARWYKGVFAICSPT